MGARFRARIFVPGQNGTSGAIEEVAFAPASCVDLGFWRHFALFATSLPRDSSFQGLELEDNLKARDGERRCSAFIVDTRNGDLLHWIRFEGTVRGAVRARLSSPTCGRTDVRRPRQPRDAHSDYPRRRGGSGSGGQGQGGEGGHQDGMRFSRNSALMCRRYWPNARALSAATAQPRATLTLPTVGFTELGDLFDRIGFGSVSPLHLRISPGGDYASRKVSSSAI